MAAPDYVPKPTDEKPRVYESPPRRPDSWCADRPAEIDGLQPSGRQLGTPGPDQGYALKLARQFEGRLVLTPGESHDDAVAGCMAIALRRASLFGRAPMIHDLTLAFTLWGYLGEAPVELTSVRKERFAVVASTHHYEERRSLVDGVPDEVLRMSHGEVADKVKADPTWVLSLSEAPAH
jgi:hypothetical protein